MVWQKNHHIGLSFLIILILTGLIFSPVLFNPSEKFFLAGFNTQVKASSLQTSVVIYICGNGTIEGPEVCDDGTNNGRYAYNALDRYCNTSCDGWAPYCGDGVVQSQYGEECEDGNNNSGDGCSAICHNEGTSSHPSSGGGGGGGISPRKTEVVIEGLAYPGAEVNFLKDGKIISTKEASDSANFKTEITDITPGIWTFSVWAKDKRGRKSITFSFTVDVQKNMVTTISGIFLPPTIELDKINLRQGEELNISGESVPKAQVLTHIESSKEIIKETTSTQRGDWDLALNTSKLEKGVHTTRAKAKLLGGPESSFSNVLTFYVGKRTKELVCPGADLNKDGRVNLVDLSILMYWWRRPNECADQNKNGKVDLPDFSIMMYYWTG